MLPARYDDDDDDGTVPKDLEKNSPIRIQHIYTVSLMLK